MSLRGLAWLLVVAPAAVVWACGARSELDEPPARADGGGGAVATTVASSTTGAGGGNGGFGGFGGFGGGGFGGLGGEGGDGGDGGSPPLHTELYAQDPSYIYTYDVNFTLTHEALFDNFVSCPYGLVDIAIDTDNTIYGSSAGGLFTINPNDGTCVLIAEGLYGNALAIAPVGVVDPNDTALMGYRASTYMRIDKSTGAQTPLGTLGSTNLTTSGDLLFFGGKAYLTAVGPNCNDCLLEIDPIDGALLANLGAIGFGSVYGLASLNGDLLGLTGGGQVLVLDRTTGAGTLRASGLPNYAGATSH